MEIGLWKDKYLIQFGEYQLDDKRDDDVVRRYNIWVSSSNTIFLVNCELLFNTIFDHNEIYEINMAMTNKNQRLSNGIITVGNQTLNNNFESYWNNFFC